MNKQTNKQTNRLRRKLSNLEKWHGVFEEINDPGRDPKCCHDEGWPGTGQRRRPDEIDPGRSTRKYCGGAGAIIGGISRASQMPPTSGNHLPPLLLQNWTGWDFAVVFFHPSDQYNLPREHWCDNHHLQLVSKGRGKGGITQHQHHQFQR